MRTPISLAALSLLALVACKDNVQPAPTGASPSSPQQAAPAAAPAAAGGTLTGKVTERIDAAQYTYLKLQTAQGDEWAAVPQTKTAVGTTVTIANPMWMKDFKSQSLNRTWDKIAFGTLQGEGGAAAGAQGQQQLPSGHPPMGSGQAAMPAGQAAMPAGHPAPAGAADVGDVKVAKAAGPDGRTVADVYAQKDALKDKKVAVRGKVVKVTNGVMGKNWLHLRDGTGSGATADLTVAAPSDTAAVGDTVTANGVVHLDRDLGAGYHYDVLLEDAQLQKK